MDLDALMNRFRGPLVGFIASLGASWGQAVELAQDTFAEAYLARERFRGAFDDAVATGPWLRGIAFNLWRNAQRRSRRAITVSLDRFDCPAPVPPEPTAHQVRLREAIDRLDGPLRAVVRMHYLEEVRVNDVAALLGVTPKTVEGRLYRARKELRRMLDEGLVTDPRATGGPARGEGRRGIRRKS